LVFGRFQKHGFLLHSRTAMTHSLALPYARFLPFLPHGRKEDEDDEKSTARGREHGGDDPANAVRPFRTVFLL
jgi:hypothetical protein